MDLYCCKCGEPVDNDCFHDRAEETGSTYANIATAFRLDGCPALGMKCNRTPMKVLGSELRVGDHIHSPFVYTGDPGVHPPVVARIRRHSNSVILKFTNLKEHRVDNDMRVDITRILKTERAQAAEAMYELLGDDMDGAAAMMEDMGL